MLKINPEALQTYMQEEAECVVLPGTAISIRAAAIKYEFPQVTVWRWAKNNWIRTIAASPAPGSKCIIDEHDVAVISSIYRKYGRWQTVAILRIMKQFGSNN